MFGGVTDMSKTARRLRRLMPKPDAEWLGCDAPFPMPEVAISRQAV
jgi:hypothetical protein